MAFLRWPDKQIKQPGSCQMFGMMVIIGCLRMTSFWVSLKSTKELRLPLAAWLLENDFTGFKYWINWWDWCVYIFWLFFAVFRWWFLGCLVLQTDFTPTGPVAHPHDVHGTAVRLVPCQGPMCGVCISAFSTVFTVSITLLASGVRKVSVPGSEKLSFDRRRVKVQKASRRARRWEKLKGEVFVSKLVTSQFSTQKRYSLPDFL